MSFEHDVNMILIMIVFQKCNAIIFSDSFPDFPYTESNRIINHPSAVFNYHDQMIGKQEY